MMYLVIKSCIESSHISCGCQDHTALSYQKDSVGKNSFASQESTFNDELNELSRVRDDRINFKEEEINASEFDKFNSGSPIRLSKSVTQVQGKI